MSKLYRINDGVKPYPGKLLKAQAEPDRQQRVWGHVILGTNRRSGLKGYFLHELTYEREGE